jgi:hypothetical protein
VSRQLSLAQGVRRKEGSSSETESEQNIFIKVKHHHGSFEITSFDNSMVIPNLCA